MTTAPSARRRLAAALAWAATAALVPQSAHAQWGKIKDLGKAAAKGAVEGTAEGAAKKAVGDRANGAPLKPSNVKFTESVLEITDERIAQLVRGLDAEAAAKPAALKKFQAKLAASEEMERTFPAREAAWKKEYAAWEARKAERDRCVAGVDSKYGKEAEKLEKESEAVGKQMEKAANETFTEDRTKRLQEMAERAQAAHARGDTKTALAIGDSLRSVIGDVTRIASMGQATNQRAMAVSRESEAALKKCGPQPEAPKQPERGGFVDGSEATREVKEAGVKASGLTERQYDVLRERVETYVRLNGRDGGGTQYIFSAGELETLAKHADGLKGKALEETYWDPRAASAKRS
jgi:hypothetical protein